MDLTEAFACCRTGSHSNFGALVYLYGTFCQFLFSLAQRFLNFTSNHRTEGERERERGREREREGEREKTRERFFTPVRKRTAS